MSCVLPGVEEPSGDNAPTVTAAGSQLSEEKLVGARPPPGERENYVLPSYGQVTHT